MTRKNQVHTSQLQDDVRVGVDKGKLRIQFSRAISQEIFDIKQKYFYLRLSDTPENRLTAERIAGQIQNDIRANKLQKELEVYSPVSQLKQQVGISYDPNRIKISTLELFEQFSTFIKPQLQESTYVSRYKKTYHTFLSEAPQDLNQQSHLMDFLFTRCASHNFVNITNLLYRMVEWGKKRDLIPPNAPNRFKEIKADYTIVHRCRPVAQLITKIQPSYHKDQDYRAYSRDEALCIINSFAEYARAECTSIKSRPLTDQQRQTRATIRDMISFNFWTGCRTCEASGLRWLDIDNDFQFIFFRHAYSTKIHSLKSLKTEKVGQEGTKPRKFPCGEKLATLLKSRKQLFYKGNDTDFVFPHLCHSPHIPLNTEHLHYHWYGCINKEKSKDGTVHERIQKGVVLQLALDKKISQYLTPYTTRHTWITLQLTQGVPIKNIAKLAGNSPEVILQSYASYVTDFDLAVEI
jgi:integrase